MGMDGPAFSTRAESEFNRRSGFDVIGMTNLPEAKLAREAEIALATMAMITDYDCWKVEEEPVSVQIVIGHLLANAETAKKILARVLLRNVRLPRCHVSRNDNGRSSCYRAAILSATVRFFSGRPAFEMTGRAAVPSGTFYDCAFRFRYRFRLHLPICSRTGRSRRLTCGKT